MATQSTLAFRKVYLLQIVAFGVASIGLLWIASSFSWIRLDKTNISLAAAVVFVLFASWVKTGLKRHPAFDRGYFLQREKILSFLSSTLVFPLLFIVAIWLLSRFVL